MTNAHANIEREKDRKELTLEYQPWSSFTDASIATHASNIVLNAAPVGRLLRGLLREGQRRRAGVLEDEDDIIIGHTEKEGGAVGLGRLHSPEPHPDITS